MTKALLALHVLAAIITVGPVTVAASMFPAAVRAGNPAQIRVLHRICNVYAAVAVAVPVFGFATAGMLHVLGTPWLIASICLTSIAALVLGAVILPAQDRILRTVGEPDAGDTAADSGRATLSRLAMCTGIFNLLWASVTVLMILRPGSTTGV